MTSSLYSGSSPSTILFTFDRSLPDMTRSVFVLTLALVVATAGCRRNPVATEASSGVSAARVPGGIRLTNHTSRGAAYAISNPNWLGLLALCNDPGAACLGLASGQSVVVPLSEIHGYTSETTAVTIYWWHVSPDGNGQYKADDPTEIVLTL